MELTQPAVFPSMYRDFVKMFPDEASCAAYLDDGHKDLYAPPASNNTSHGEPEKDD